MSLYEFWNKAVVDPSKIGTDELPVHENSPQAGFYRMRGLDGADMVPVAIWEDGKQIAKAGDKMVLPVDVWSFCCRYPVTHKQYTDAINGKGWGDTPPTLDEVPGIGHNQPQSDFERMTIEFNAEKELAEEFMKKPIDNQQDADKVANWTKRISEYSTKATALHKVEKQPALDESRRIDDKWRDLKDEPKSLATKMKRFLTPWLDKLEAEEAERQRVAREKLAQAQREAEAAARKAEDTHPNPNDPEAEAAARKAEEAAAELKQAQKDAKAQTTNVGRTGSKVTLREFTSGLVEDYDKALVALKDHPEVKALVQTLADRSARAGVPVDGVKIVKEKRAV